MVDATNSKQQQPAPFNPREHLMQIKSREGNKDYLPVQWRLVWFREMCPQGTINTEEIVVDIDREMTIESFAWNQEKRRSEKVMKTATGYARFKATVTDGKGGQATGHGSECAADFPDFLEKAETKAIGRALAALGYGTQFAPEFNEEHRIVDAPVESQGREDTAPAPITVGEKVVAPTPITRLVSVQPNQQQKQQAAPPDSAAAITDQQLTSIRKLVSHLGKGEPDELEHFTYEGAKDLIATFTKEYRESRRTETTVSSPTTVPPVATAAPQAKATATIAVVPLNTPSSSSTPPVPATDASLTLWEEKLGPYAFNHLVFAMMQVIAKREDWTPAQIGFICERAQEWYGTGKYKEWIAQPRTPEQVEEYRNLERTFGTKNLNALLVQLGIKHMASECTRGEMDRVLYQMRKHFFTCRLAQAIDLDPATRTYVLLTQNLKNATHPLGLIGRDDDMLVYQALLIDKSRTKVVPPAFLAQHGEELKRLQEASEAEAAVA